MELKDKNEIIDLSEIFHAIKTYQAGKGKAEAFGIANAFARALKADENCLILYQIKENAGKKEKFFMMMKDKNGDPMFPIFTDMEKILAVKEGMEKNAQVEIGAMNLKTLFSMFRDQKMCKTVVVNPFKQNFLAQVQFYINLLEKEPVSHITLIETNYMDIHADAVVCPTDQTISGSTELEQMIFSAAGETFEPTLREKWGEQTLNVADVVAVESNSNLHSKYVFFTGLPEFSWELKPEVIFEFFANAMNAAKTMECTSIAFPCTTKSMKGMPMEVVIGASTKAVTRWLAGNPDVAIDVYFCCDNSEEIGTYQAYFAGLKR